MALYPRYTIFVFQVYGFVLTGLYKIPANLDYIGAMRRFILGLSYPFVSRWGWYESGWLKTLGYRDFGGSGIVHLYSGACAFVAARIIGPRAGRFGPNAQHFAGHSLPV